MIDTRFPGPQALGTAFHAHLESIQSLETNMQDARALDLGEVREQKLSRVGQRSFQGPETHCLGLLVLGHNAALPIAAIAADVLLQLEGVRLPMAAACRVTWRMRDQAPTCMHAR